MNSTAFLCSINWPEKILKKVLASFWGFDMFSLVRRDCFRWQWNKLGRLITGKNPFLVRGRLNCSGSKQNAPETNRGDKYTLKTQVQFRQTTLPIGSTAPTKPNSWESEKLHASLLIEYLLRRSQIAPLPLRHEFTGETWKHARRKS